MKGLSVIFSVWKCQRSPTLPIATNSLEPLNINVFLQFYIALLCAIMASKRHVVEEGNTPGKPANKRQSENANTGSRKTLFPGEAKPK